MSCRWQYNFYAWTLMGVLITDTFAAQSPPTHSKEISNHEAVKIKIGETLLDVRTRLLGLGWTPVHVHSNDNYSYSGAEARLVERHFFEVDSCSTDRGANCVLYYRRQRQCLRLDTVGEEVKDMKITRWTNECPS